MSQCWKSIGRSGVPLFQVDVTKGLPEDVGSGGFAVCGFMVTT